MVILSRDEVERYDRQIMIFGTKGQIKLKEARVAVLSLIHISEPTRPY